MNIHSEKLELVKLILETENIDILTKIKTLLKVEKKKDFWDDLTQKQKDEINVGLSEIENGDVVDYEEFIKSHR